ncbi:uncharacterized protein LOC141651635 [Silene latifolia]|uniref:uncharacterized protein LOC141651635 n=1 Tax=Silene latifolia TaxID=37657 RepID=UPI003D7745EA
MLVVAATGPEKEACMCKGFGSTLSGAALQCSRKPENLSSDLYRIVQRSEESTRDYLARFNVEKLSTPRCDPTTAVNAFRRGLHRDSDLFKDLTKHPYSTFEEVKQMAEATYRLEEDEDRRDLYGTESSSRKITTEKKNERAKPYNKNTVNKVSEEKESTEAPPKLSEYRFTTGHAGVLKAIRELWQRARWPKKPTPRENDRRDAIKSAGCLDHLLPKGAKSGKVNTADQAQPSPPPPYSNVVSVITGGSEICGLAYSAAKRHATETKGDKPEFSLRVSRQDLPAISFDEADIPDEAEHHHDALIITLSIGNCLVKKILVDTGSSVNHIMLETFKNMGFSEKDLVQKAVPLVGFSGETKQSLGEIVIPTFAGGINKQVRYLVIDGPSTYNVILGKSWIHEMKAVSSTYHQSLKFPTSWGYRRYGEIKISLGNATRTL